MVWLGAIFMKTWPLVTQSDCGECNFCHLLSNYTLSIWSCSFFLQQVPVIHQWCCTSSQRIRGANRQHSIWCCIGRSCLIWCTYAVHAGCSVVMQLHSIGWTQAVSCWMSCIAFPDTTLNTVSHVTSLQIYIQVMPQLGLVKCVPDAPFIHPSFPPSFFLPTLSPSSLHEPLTPHDFCPLSFLCPSLLPYSVSHSFPPSVLPPPQLEFLTNDPLRTPVLPPSFCPSFIESFPLLTPSSISPSLPPSPSLP